jgi:hypothetical protein
MQKTKSRTSIPLPAPLRGAETSPQHLSGVFAFPALAVPEPGEPPRLTFMVKKGYSPALARGDATGGKPFFFLIFKRQYGDRFQPAMPGRKINNL